jgi:cobalt-zinc-cadmium efflux system membrane fusion protein
MSIRPEGRRWTAAMLMLAGIGLSTLGGCSREDARPAPAAAPARDPMHVKAEDELLKRLQVAPAVRVEIQEYIRVAGSVQVDEDRVARIGSSVTGRITDAPGTLGLDVRAGQMLATLDSAELAAAQRNFLKAGLDLELVQRAVERARLLVNADVIGSAELQRRENEQFSAEAELRTTRGNLLLLGMSGQAIERLENTRAISPVISIASKLSGTVIERRVTIGQVVQPADQLFTIADLSQVWVVSEVPEEQAFGVRVGDPVEVSIPALRDRRLDGKVTFVGNTVNPETRTITVRTVLPNADRSIKPAMLASMAIREPVRRALAVPAAAVVREGNRDHVFVQAKASLFHLRPVTLGPESNNGLRPVLGGLSEGEPVVVDGAFHLNNERNRQ